MKKALIVLFLLSLGGLCSAEQLVVIPSGQIIVGTSVQFQVPGMDAADRFDWNFDDGQQEPNRQGNVISHTFNQVRSFHVTALEKVVTGPGRIFEATVVVVDNRRVSAQGSNFRQGKRVNFQAENFASNSLSWEFGDGTAEPGPRNHGHVYNTPGRFQVKATDSVPGAVLFATCQVDIGADNRQLSASPNAPRANQSVAFSAQNFPGGAVSWDFGDGTVENGGPSHSHVFRNPGNFQVRAWESAAAASEAVGLALTVSPDSRRLQTVPSPPRAGAAVQFTASNFMGGDLRWSYGDGRTENGGPVMNHVYSSPGNFQVLVWEGGQGQDSALRTNLSVQPDARQVVLSGPSEIFEGAEVTFEGRNFSSPNLKWDFGDGTVERAGTRQAHRFQRPGQFMVKAVEADTANLPLETRVQVLSDNRSLVLKSIVVFANSEFEIEARNFRGGSVNWNFGDGAIQTGGRLMKHRYARTGQFRVRAVDFAGRDGKFIEKLIQVENDTRVLVLPSEIIAGEEVSLQLQNAPGGSFNWKFSDGESHSGPDLRAKVFRSAGPQKIMVIDPSGKFPPLEKTIQVIPDVRALKASAEFALPKEAVTFTAANFKGPGIHWDFGDGTVKENGTASEKHVYAALGRYKVKAVDFGGRSSKPFSVDVVVAEITPGFEVSLLEFAFDSGKYYRVIPKNSPSPGYKLRVNAKGRGVLNGQFVLDNQSIGLFQLVVQENQTAVLPKTQMSTLPAIDLGLHALTLKFTNYSFPKRIPVIKYFVTAAGVIQIVSPLIDGKVPAKEKVQLRWSIERKKKLEFEIAISAVPFQFLDDKQVQWLPVGTELDYAFDPAPYKAGDWIYWQVRMLNESKQVQTVSEIASFKLSE